MIGGIVLQTIILIIVTSITNWKKEVSTEFLLLIITLNRANLLKPMLIMSRNSQADQAESRVKQWEEEEEMQICKSKAKPSKLKGA